MYRALTSDWTAFVKATIRRLGSCTASAGREKCGSWTTGKDVPFLSPSWFPSLHCGCCCDPLSACYWISNSSACWARNDRLFAHVRCSLLWQDEIEDVTYLPSASATYKPVRQCLPAISVACTTSSSGGVWVASIEVVGKSGQVSPSRALENKRSLFDQEKTFTGPAISPIPANPSRPSKYTKSC